ncbi:MAG: dihydroorotate dehydrogenase electron transfer subunit [Tannerella sp.]|jgi:dihydroorotate dehydrogenase electron transfer subunit|nr:dihydroorotate dehydrogenase electron transfer subunit [Tannerella sp.]
MKKYLMDMRVVENVRLHPLYCLLKLTSDRKLPGMIPGQFVQVRVDGSFLRRPVSINYVDREANELWLLVRIVGEGTRRMAEYQSGDLMNIMLPLGNGFSMPQLPAGSNLLLIGGGAGAAPMLYLGDTLKSLGFRPAFLLGARSKDELMQLDEFEKNGDVYLTTEDGSTGERGFVTHHRILAERKFDRLYACGPKPMMVAVAKYAKAMHVACDVSLENRMACGIGACLCCIEHTAEGNVCVCTEGPVFNINQLTWQI